MARPALLRISTGAVLLLLCARCHLPEQQGSAGMQINSADSNLNPVNGILYRDNELFTGTVYTLYPGTTDTATIANFVDGKEQGVWKKFYDNGSLKEKRSFENGRKTGEYVAYWENGLQQLQYFFENDVYEGTCREWNRDGTLIKEMNYKNGYEKGSQKMFYDNGKVRSNYTIINGRRYGLLGTKNCVNVSDSIF